MVTSPLFRLIFTPKMLVALMMGFSCGLPLLLTMTVLQAWMKEEGVDLTVIGMTSLLGLPYTVKFLWAPIMDRFVPGFLGRRRGWLLIAQIFLMISIIGLAMSHPSKYPYLTIAAACMVTFFSASQDIVADAYRREDLSDAELGLGVSLYINGYRVGMLLASGGGLMMADKMSFSGVYLIMALCMIPGIVTTLLASEPRVDDAPPKTLRSAVVDPLIEYFSRSNALWILAFILLYKIGDTMATAISTPFYMDIGFSKTEIGAVVKLFGFWATFSGSLIAGILMIRLGINRSLWIFGVLQAVTILGFAALANIGHNILALSAVIAAENLTAGMGTSAYTAFMASITHKKFTATQYALLSSLMGIPRVIISAPTGAMAKFLGWEAFFAVCTIMAVPGMLLLIKFAPWHSEDTESARV